MHSTSINLVSILAFFIKILDVYFLCFWWLSLREMSQIILNLEMREEEKNTTPHRNSHNFNNQWRKGIRNHKISYKLRSSASNLNFSSLISTMNKPSHGSVHTAGNRTYKKIQCILRPMDGRVRYLYKPYFLWILARLYLISILVVHTHTYTGAPLCESVWLRQRNGCAHSSSNDSPSSSLCETYIKRLLYIVIKTPGIQFKYISLAAICTWGFVQPSWEH